ncbi:hypothetical protein ACWDA3_00295 [Nonomuraea rubra]
MAAVAQAGLLAAETLPVGATTAVTPGPSWAGSGHAPPPPGPTSVSEVAWQWRPPDGEPVRQVVAAGGHVVVRTSDGVVAVDSITGRERWHCRRPGAAAAEVLPFPNGGMVAVVFVKMRKPLEARKRTVLLNAHTGEVRSEQPRGRRANAALTSHGFVTADAGEVAGWGLLDTGEPIWSFSPDTTAARGPPRLTARRTPSPSAGGRTRNQSWDFIA